MLLRSEYLMASKLRDIKHIKPLKMQKKLALMYRLKWMAFMTPLLFEPSGFHTLIGLVPRLQWGWRSMDCTAGGASVTHTVRLSLSVCLSLSCPRLQGLCVSRHANQTSLITVWVSVGPRLNALNYSMITFGNLCLQGIRSVLFMTKFNQVFKTVIAIRPCFHENNETTAVFTSIFILKSKTFRLETNLWDH